MASDDQIITQQPKSDQSPPSNLPLKEIPGDYGLPILGPIKDRYDYNYFEGHDEFIKSRMEKYQSTVFRMNMLPGQFMVSNPKVVVLLDAVSFPVLFDLSKVEKKDVLDGTFVPSLAFTGGYRTCAYLDPSEPKHNKLKRLFISLLASCHDRFIPESQNCLNDLFKNIESNISEKGEAYFNTLSDDMAFDFVLRLFFNTNPTDTKIGKDGPNIISKWLFLQLHPLITLGLPKMMSCVEDFFLHTFPLPSFFVKSDYQKIYDVIYASSACASLLDQAEELGIGRDEAAHNLVFLAGFNAFGGMKALFPALMKWVGLGGEKLHKDLVDEIRTVVKSEGGVTFGAIEKMTLTKSVVYEALRIEPPVPYQYAKAKEDLVIQSHDASFQVKKGEMLFGYQPFATKDPKVFENPEEFIGTRFVGEEGEKLLKYVFWSNERETVSPTESNKQCPAKDLVVLLSRVMVIEFFLRYDSFTIQIKKLPLGSGVTVKSLTKATT
ncbi:Cytochrome P450 [Macleaya cordata]|uniref:Cytochrome P450 n=1 Tax=Macleaya cordata TaxID=56857 RepID=A0A200R7F4_MACCD|nr:Cytochrome P450 [Macleaya cordata]